MIGKVPRELVVRLGWTTTSFGIIQVLRFANNVILARLLSPPLLGAAPGRGVAKATSITNSGAMAPACDEGGA